MTEPRRCGAGSKFKEGMERPHDRAHASRYARGRTSDQGVGAACPEDTRAQATCTAQIEGALSL
jgi:hypothetical protein